MEFEDFCFSNMEETEDKRVLVIQYRMHRRI